MAHIVQYACVPDALTHKRAQMNGKTVMDAGVAGRNLITPEGYIISTAKVGVNTVSKVIDPPCFVSWGDPQQVNFVMRYAPVWAMTGARDIFTVSEADPPAEIAPPSAAPTYYTLPALHKYVGVNVPIVRNPSFPDQGASGYGNITGVWACTSLVTVYRAPDGEVYDSLLFLATSSKSPLGDSGTGESESTILLALPSEAVRAAGEGYEMTAFTGSTFPPYSHLELTIDVLGNEVRSVYVSVPVHVGLHTGASTDQGIFVARVDVSPGRLQTFVWARVLHTDRAATGPHAGGTGGIGVVGDSLVVHVANNYPLGGAHPTEAQYSKLTVLNKLTGAVLTDSAPGPGDGGASKAMVTCTTDNGVWGTVSTRADPSLSAVSNVQLVRFDGATFTVVPTPGYYPAGAARLPGMTGAVSSTLGKGRSVVCDLSEGRVGVLVTPAADYGDHAAIPYYLLELDETTLEVLSVRGPIGSTPSLVTDGGYSKTISTVTQQKVTDGIVTTPAVLLCCLGSTTRLSRDGGDTWAELTTGAYGTPLYRGNRLHPVILGKTL